MSSKSLYNKKVSDLFDSSGEEIQSEIEQFNDESSSAEKKSWRNSFPKLIEILKKAGLGNLYILAEYELPAGGRIDAILLGSDDVGNSIALIIELKQWSREGVRYWDGSDFPAIRVDAKEPYYSRHPVVQTDEYVRALSRNFSNIINGKLLLKSCQYMHSFQESEKEFFNQGLFANIDTSHMYFAGEEEKLIDYLQSVFSSSIDGEKAKDIFLEGKYETTEMDMEIINQITKSPENIPLWHDQTRIMDDVKVLLERQAKNELENKYMVLISGAAGTGKTIVGFRILAEYWQLYRNKKIYNCVYTLPRSRTIKQVLEGLSNDNAGIRPVFLNNLTEENRDLIVVDEGHRITELNQTGNILNRAQIVIVLQDDNQRVLGNEIGTKDKYREFACENGFKFVHFKLDYQKRSGLGSYVDRIDRLLYNKEYNNDVGLGINILPCDSLKDLDESMARYHNKTKSVKYFAPYCWKWKSRNDLSAIDISISDGNYIFQKQWNPMYNQYEWFLDSINQVGCVYTAQGLGFDYVGLIWWDDLVWRTDHWEVNIDLVTKYDSSLRDSMRHRDMDYDYLILNIYRVLLTRAKKEICIWFKDSETREHFESICFCHSDREI